MGRMILPVRETVFSVAEIISAVAEPSSQTVEFYLRAAEITPRVAGMVLTTAE